MRHITSKQLWGTVDLDTRAGAIFVQEDWQYSWQVLGSRIQAWTLAEKRRFHDRIDREVWSFWSSHFKINVTGNGPIAEHLAGRSLELDFDLRWVLHGGEWHVNVYKVPHGTPAGFYRSNVAFGTRVINLYSNLFTPYSAMNDAGATQRGFLTPPHEFGHTMDNPDEYLRTSPFLYDTASLMNIGHHLRVRHVHLILATLNAMVPGAEFHAS